MHLRLLGAPRAVVAGQELTLERKDALLFAWLAIEGPTPRARLASLLFPDADDAGARGALRQRMYRARRSALATMVVGDDPCRLADATQIDVGDPLAPGELLAGVHADDLPELAEWLEAQRARRRRVRIETSMQLSEQAEAEGDLAAALAHADAVLDADALFEPAHRRVMRLHYLRGDLPSATTAYERVRKVLRRELGATPAQETEDLRRQIDAGARPPSVPRAMPVTVLRPPRLIGREAEWSALDAAWTAGSAALIRGEPGMGKTRLAADLARTRPGAVTIAARPGDRDAPYAVLSRLLRALLPRIPGALPPGVTAELARLLPELGAAEPMKSGADRARFLNAIETLVALAMQAGLAGIVFDDLQYADAASTEALHHLSGRHAGLAWLAAYRTGELSAAGQAFVDTLAGVHESRSISLSPLGERHIADLIASLAIDELDAEQLAAPLARRTGGNPFFLLEAIKALLAPGQRAPGAKSLPLAPNVGALIERRIARLSPEAIRLARCAAVAGQDHSIDLAARVLGVRALDLADAWNELEAAQVLRDGAFAHDLVYEAALASVPPPIAQSLHGEIASYLQGRDVEPSRIALHFEASRQFEAAANLWIKTGHAAERALRFAEAADAFERAARLLGDGGQNKRAFDAAFLMRHACFEVDLAARSGAALDLLDRFATTPMQRALAHNEHAVTLLHRGEMAETERHALAGLTALGGADEPLLRAELRRNLAAVLAWRNDTAAALREMRSVQADVERLGSPAQRFELWDSLAILLSHADQCAEAEATYERAIALAIEQGNLPGAAQTVLNLAVQFFDCGAARRALNALERARNLLAAVGDEATPYSSLHLNYGLTLRALGDYAASLEHFDRAMVRAQQQTPGWLPLVAASKAQTLVYLGQHARAQQALAASAPGERTPPLAVSKWQAIRHMLARAQGQQAGSSLSTLIEGYPLRGRQLVRWRMQAIDLAGRDADPSGLEQALQLVHDVTAATRTGLAIHAHARVAAAARRQRRADLARHHARAALALMRDHEPDDIYPGEVVQIAVAALREGDAADVDEARAALRRIIDWIRRTAEERVPAEYRDSFLARNPANRELLTSASRLLN
ncbi:MAG TPA: AAA family ATPase [Burkholderiaceae bacterium]|nr:AAA family ATPase [Burkholderiaceae bacterium]